MVRRVLIVALVAGVAGTSAADPLQVFAKRWPKLAHEVAPMLARCDPAQPPSGDDAPSSVSPDGKTLVVIAPLSLSAAEARQLGVAETSGMFALVFDGPGGRLWATPMSWFPGCIPNAVTWTWSKDDRRVLAMTDTGHGTRDVLLDVRARKVIAGGFDNLVLASPGLSHLATTPWEAGRLIDPDKPAVFGTQLFVDGEAVWGSGDPDAADVWDLEWRSETRLELCGKTKKLAAARYAIVIGKKVAVSRITGACGD